MRRRLKGKRERAAERLVRTLIKELLKVLGKAGDPVLSATQLLKRIGTGLTQELAGMASTSDKETHTIRKLAKIARYKSESAPGSALARQAAANFNQLQSTGGAWHDCLELSQLSEWRLAEDHPATLVFAEERDRNLARFRDILSRPENHVVQHKEKGSRKSASAVMADAL